MTWGLIGAAAIGVVGSALTSRGGSSGGGGGGSGGNTPTVYDPYGPYRGAAATRLNSLMADPSSLQSTPEWQASQQGAARAMAAQGYTGSGNALVAAANASGQVYQQAFNNLSMLSGAGQSPAAARSAFNSQQNYQQGQSNRMWGQVGSLVGRFIGGRNGGGGTGGVGYGGGSGYSSGGNTPYFGSSYFGNSGSSGGGSSYGYGG